MRHCITLLICTAVAIYGVATSGVAPLSAQTLRGSHESVDLMYSTAQTGDLSFLRNSREVYAAAHAGALRMLSFNNDLELHGVKYPFVLPNTLRFADSLAAAYHAGCGERLVVTSGARPLDEQPRNASPKSVHPTGMAVDFRKPRTPACLAWLRTNLLALEDRHVIEATEERHPAHFHVAVLRQAREPRITFAAGDVALEKPKAKVADATKATKVAHKHHSVRRKHASAESAAEDR